jgi:TonB family protein
VVCKNNQNLSVCEEAKMSEEILVVEYEPRYTDRVRQALVGRAVTPRFAKDGEEALTALAAHAPRLIVLSSVIPKMSTNELIQRIRSQAALRATPILLTVSGYNGKSTRGDAVKLGASDILPKPYSEGEFLGKVLQLLGMEGTAAWAGDLGAELTVVPVSPPIDTSADGTLTSDDIFGDLLDDDRPAAQKKKKADEDLDKMLADTLSGVRVAPKKKAEGGVRSGTSASPIGPISKPAQEAKKQASEDLDALLNETLSGLEKTVRMRKDELTAPTRLQAAAPPPPAVDPAKTEQIPLSELQATLKVPTAAIVPEKTEDEGEGIDDGARFGQYVLLEKIATGGMAEVWKARMRGVEGFQKLVAIKKILPHLSDNQEFVEMFVDEAKLAAQLSHNNIIHIYDLGKIVNSYYIAMELIDGQDLKSILRRSEERGQPIPVELALFIGSKIASALDYAHRKRGFDDKELGLVHRDVSPQNVLISYEGDIKLCDFGIAKAASKASHTQAGALKGKLQYMSPEQAWGKKIDRRSDVFALATVMFEMLTGRKLFTGESELSILEQVREARVVRVSDYNDEASEEIDQIITKALQKEPDARYQSAGEMARDIDQILYSFRPTPASADLAIFMHRIYSEDEPVIAAAPAQETVAIRQEPRRADLLTVPDVIEIPLAPVVAAQPPSQPEPEVAAAPVVLPVQEESGRRGFPVIPIGIAAIVVAALGIGGYVMTRPSSEAPLAPASTVAAATVPQVAVPLPVDPSAEAAELTETGLGAGDQAVIDLEVRKRLEAERLRIEQQRTQQERQREQQAAAAAAPAPTATTAPPVQTAAATPPPAATQTAAPAPTTTVAEERPAPAAVAPPQPAPAAVQPTTTQAAATVRQGDFVEAGTPGLIAPDLIRMNQPTYPPMARQRRLEGVVLVNALVSEDGRVIDVTILRNINPDIGFSNSAIEAVRGATFRPATKDGVRVKANKVIQVAFKL